MLTADTGANDLQNHPVVWSASTALDPAKKEFKTTVHWTLDSEPGTYYRLEFFASPGCDDSTSGQGRTFLGAVQVHTDLLGHAGVSRVGTVLTSNKFGGEQISATATPVDKLGQDPAGTSELSPCRLATTVPAAS